MLPFTKMHGAGNDYVYLDAIRDAVPAGKAALAKLARQVSERHTGLGADGLIVLAPSKRADVRMVMFNADGSESEMCGNGIRCLAKLAFDHGHVRGPEVRVETGAGVLSVTLEFTRGACTGATVRMGRPRLTPAEVPVRLKTKGPLMVLDARVAGHHLTLHAVGMGNPHAVCFVDDPDTFPVAEVGSLIEHDKRFPRRTNVEFVARAGFSGGKAKGVPVLRQRTWERGSGETQACGTGACATVVAAILTGAIRGRTAVVRLNGGDLRVTWADDQAEVVMSGPAETVFRGVWADGRR